MFYKSSGLFPDKRQFAFTAFLACATLAQTLHAAPLVNSLADPGYGVCDGAECTLREAIAAASPGDEITFAASLNGGTVVLASPLDIGGIVTITGPDISVDATAASIAAILVNDAEDDVTLRGLTILGKGLINSGTVSLGGVTVAVTSGTAVSNAFGGTMTIADSTISGGIARIGGGISNNAGNLTVLDSTIHSNTADHPSNSGLGAGFYQTGNATTTMTNVTLSNNTAKTAGGGMWVEGGTVTVINSTITDNHANASDGGGVAVNNATTNVSLKNSIVAGNTAGMASFGDCSSAAISRTDPVSNGDNLFGTGTGCPLSATDIAVADAATVVAALADNGGPTLTHALQAGSAAIDSGDAMTCAGIATDQRGATRSVGADCDSGAFESGPPAIALDPANLDFGMVDNGTSLMMIINVSNAGNELLSISNIALPTGEFSFSADATPITLHFDETADVDVTFTPTTSGVVTADLTFTSDDPVNGTPAATLSGTGVPEDTDPLQQIQDILDYFDQSIADDRLVGAGPGKSGPKRANALRNMIEAAGDLLDYDITGACVQLQDALNRTDGEPKPPEFVQGTAGAATLATMISDLRSELACAN